MPYEPRRPTAPRLLLGMFVVLMGVALILDQLGVEQAHGVIRFWPCVLIAFGLFVLLGGRRRLMWGLLLIVIGTWLLLNTLGIVTLQLGQFIFPLVLVILGTRIMTRAPRRVWDRQRCADGSVSSSVPTDLPAPGPASSEEVSEHATLLSVLSSSRRRWGQSIFRSAEATCIMGGCELDLRDASLGADGTAQIEAFILMGGLKIFVPPDWTVVTHVTPLMGGIDDKSRSVPAASPRRLIVDGTVVMGGIEIGN